MRGPVDPRLLRHARGAWGGVAALVVVAVVQAVLTLVVVVAVTGVVVALVGNGAAAGWVAVLAVALALRALTAWGQAVLAQRVAARVGSRVRTSVLAAAVAKGPAWTARFGTGRLAAVATAGPDALRPWFSGYLPSLVAAVVLPPLVVVAMVVVDPLSGVVTLLTLPLIPVFGALVGWATQRRAAERWAAGARLSGHFLDVVRGLATLKLFGRAERQVDEVRRTTEAHRDATMRVLRVAFLSTTALDLVATLSVGLVAVEAGLRVASGSMAFGPALLVILLAPEAYRPLREVGARFHAAADAGAVVDDLDAVLAPLREGERVTSVRGRPGAVVTALVVRHEGALRDAVGGLSLTVAEGEVVALRGPSGAGKTTALRVLAGVQGLDGGVVSVTGPPPLHLPQRPMLPFVATVREALGVADDPWAVLAAVGLADEIAALPLGLDQPLGENGEGLSSGQRQRLALARVLADARRAPSLLLLDEPTAHLDEAAERLVLAELRSAAARGCAVLLTAHRPAALAAATRTITLPTLRDQGIRTRREDSGGTAPSRPAGSDSLITKKWWGRGSVAVALGAGAWGAGVVLTGAAAWLLVRASTLPPVLTLSAAVVTVRGSAVARPLLRYLERLVSHEVAFRRLGEWRSDVYARLVPLVPGARFRRGDLLTGVVDDVDARVDGLLRGRFPALAAGVVAVAAVGAAALALPSVAVVPAVAAVGAGLLVPAGAAHRAQEHERATAAARASVATAVVETVEAVEELAATGDPEPARRIDALARVERARAWSAGAFDAVGQLVWSAAVVVTAVLVLRSGLGHEVGAVLVLATLALAEPMAGLPEAAIARRRAAVAAARLDLPPAAPARTRTTTPAVHVEALTAGWDPTRAPALENLALDVRPGGSVAVTGVSGSGKSTLAAVLAGLLDPWQGAVTTPAKVGLVGDGVDHVFASTVRENLRLARPDATDDDLRAALAAVRLGPWVQNLPDGLDTWLGEGGGTISGGERRRLATARALLADPDLLILDEPTEGLDEETAESLVRDLLDAARGRTTILFTHRREGLDLVEKVREMGGRTLVPA